MLNIWNRLKGKPFSGLVSYSSLEIMADRLTDPLMAVIHRHTTRTGKIKISPMQAAVCVLHQSLVFFCKQVYYKVMLQ